MNYDQYRQLQSAYINKHPYENTGTYFSPQEIVSGSASDQGTYDSIKHSNDMRLTNDWMKTLNPAQQDEFKRLYQQHYEATQASMNRTRNLALAVIAGVAGAGFAGLGAGAGLGAAEGAGGGLSSIAGADIAGGLIPQFGTTAGYTAGMGTGLSSAFIPGADSAFSGINGWGGASSIPGAVDLGSAGGIMSTGTGQLGAGATSGLGSNFSWKDLLSGGGKMFAGGGQGNGIDWGKLLSGIGTAYQGSRGADQYGDVLGQINSLYAPDSPYAKQMEQSLARKDAAAGRNSQYGPRAVELAAALTKSKSDALTSAGYGNLLGNRTTNQNIPINVLSSLFGSGAFDGLISTAGGNVGSWLDKLFGGT